jgi:hypothetical protein
LFSAGALAGIPAPRFPVFSAWRITVHNIDCFLVFMAAGGAEKSLRNNSGTSLLLLSHQRFQKPV